MSINEEIYRKLNESMSEIMEAYPDSSITALVLNDGHLSEFTHTKDVYTAIDLHLNAINLCLESLGSEANQQLVTLILTILNMTNPKEQSEATKTLMAITETIKGNTSDN